jgi:signal transduction histidine kinase
MSTGDSRPDAGLSRRELFLGAGVAVTSAAIAANATAASGAVARETAVGTAIEPLYGEHQSGVRTPMQAHSVFATFNFTQACTASALAGVMKVATTEAERLTRMINDLLDLSRIEAGRLEMSPGELSLEPVFARAVDATQPLCAEKGISVFSTVEEDLPPVFADADRLHQVLTNLLANAVKFSPEGGTIRLSGTRKERFALISVSDEGPGIPPDRLEQIFERFHQVRDTQKSQPLGTGLGLTISREIVDTMGGNIRAESELGHGAVFYFTVPLV